MDKREKTEGETEKKKNAMTPVEYIKKYSRNRDKELKYDFMPKILEIIERPANRAGTVIILGIFTLLVVAVVWTCMSKLDIVITTTGNIQPIGNLNVVQSYMGGTVTSINVSEGAYVEAGDILIELDTQSLEIDVNQLNSQKMILETQQEIYTKISNGEDLTEMNVAKYDTEIQNYVQAILDADTNYQNTLANLEFEKSNAELNQQIAQLQLEEYRRIGTQSQRETQELTVKQYELAYEQAELQLEDSKTQYSAQIHSKLAEISSQLDEIENKLAQYSLSKESQELVAPVSGYVNSIDVNTVGETVTSGQELITIVPSDMQMEMVCYVKNMDIADIELGMEAEIKLEAYSYNKYGTVKGVVTYISPSAFASEQMGNVYLVKLDIVDKNEDINIISGLSGTVEIKTGQRTVMEYFMEPIMKGFGDSMKEK